METDELKASNQTVNKAYAEYGQRELNEKSKKTGKALVNHVVSLSVCIQPVSFQWLKSGRYKNSSKIMRMI